MSAPGERFEVRAIGVMRTPYRELAEIPRQARLSRVRARIELFEGMGLEDAIEDLAGWDYVWVLTWMHLARGWRPKVLPPRSERKRGVLGTRAPHRPNPIGLSAMRIVGIEGRTIEVEECDALDGTPVLDLKPYVPWADAIPDAKSGWLTPPEGTRLPGGERPSDPRPTWEVRFSELAREQLAFLRARGVELEERLAYALSLGPQPHAYRRIASDGEGARRIAIKEWYARFVVAERAIEVVAIRSGVRARELARAGDVHREFEARWPRTARA